MANPEVCTGCGEVSGQPFPFVGVGKDSETGAFAAFPVCFECWKNPEHRKVKLKMHFFPRQQAENAVAKAGSDNIGGD